MSFGVGCRCGLDPVLLWLWCRPVATAPIRPLTWEPPCAMGVALKRQKDKKKILLLKGVNHHLSLYRVASCNLFATVTSKITNHSSYHKNKYNNEKVWDIIRITKMWHRDRKWISAVGKMALFDWCKVVINLQSVKNTVSLRHNKVKCNKTRYAYT